jgi:hypothetical protein
MLVEVYRQAIGSLDQRLGGGGFIFVGHDPFLEILIARSNLLLDSDIRVDHPFVRCKKDPSLSRVSGLNTKEIGSHDNE